jgi:hypothetical protein
MYEVSSKGISPIFPCKQLYVVDGQVTHKGEPVKCHWCKWFLQPDDIAGADGLLLGGFTRVIALAHLARRRHYKLLIHSCQGRRANPLQLLSIAGGEMEPQPQAKAKAKGKAQPVEVG